jgi:hypothetical protein
MVTAVGEMSFPLWRSMEEALVQHADEVLWVWFKPVSLMGGTSGKAESPLEVPASEMEPCRRIHHGSLDRQLSSILFTEASKSPEIADGIRSFMEKS